MKVLGIMGSPRKKGNTNALLDAALETAVELGAQVEKIILEELVIAPCSEAEYEHVLENGYPVVKDDIYFVIDKMRWADAIILASPVFFGSLSAQVKTMVDRFQCVWISRREGWADLFSEKKEGAFICCEATDRQDFLENASSIVKHFFATCNIEYSEELLCKGLESAQDAEQNKEILLASKKLARAVLSDKKQKRTHE